MVTLSADECSQKCEAFTLQSRLSGCKLVMQTDQVCSAKYNLTRDCDRIEVFCRSFPELVRLGDHVLLLVTDWGIHPTPLHVKLISLMRENTGESRPLIEAPGHLLENEPEMLSLLSYICLTGGWDFWVFNGEGDKAISFDHHSTCTIVSTEQNWIDEVGGTLSGWD